MHTWRIVLATEPSAESCQNFAPAGHAKQLTSIITAPEHIYVRRNRIIEAALTGGQPKFSVQADT